MYKEAFPKRLQEARNQAGYTQRQVAQIIGISQSTLASYEIGRTEPDIETLGKLAQFYNTNMNWLFGVTIEPEIRPEKKS